ncbi:agmatine deiminase family protein [Fulvivirga sp. M361]|uniref:agmatine deiminase family protein n=1 Tax=Fulvivirga sp. M361 TaxID=2594266 RepID=UPI00117A3022|nr:agmatine deiminase family protein [Fulvivirga sp. M361]TRX60836.1 agmatine deiminase family protein [Fulvivirga sp. M361]
MSSKRIVAPGLQGYYFPAEWHTHEATWLSFPHNKESWPGKMDNIYTSFATFVRYLSLGEKVRINVNDEQMKDFALEHFIRAGANMDNVEFYLFATNDAWCRDHGPAFLINPRAKERKVVVNWEYNAWGNKYPPYDLDNAISVQIADHLNVPVFSPGIVMEGGAVEFNGNGTLITTRACLLNVNRNPHLSFEQIEQYLKDYYGVTHLIWLEDGIVGDDTDGHVDDLTRFVDENTIVTLVEKRKQDANYTPLKNNLKLLQQATLENGKRPTIVELPCPSPVLYKGQRLPASYANFYIANEHVIMPTFRDTADDAALSILQECFDDREVVGIDSLDIIWGLGSFHCLSMQEPLV